MNAPIETFLSPDRPATPRVDEARALLRRLVWVYQGGCAAALVITLLLVLLGLELDGRQWAILLLGLAPIAVAIYNLSDVALIVRHTRPVRVALRELDAGRDPPQAIVATALVRALNLPIYSFLRVTFFHGPLVSLLICGLMVGANAVVAAGFATWQILAFAAMAMFFASPTHAIFEYFGVAGQMVPTILRLNRALGVALPPAYHNGLVAVRLKSKLLYLAIFVTALPLAFFAVSMVFKVQRLLLAQGVRPTAAALVPFYAWIAGVVAVCMLGSVAMALLTALDVSRSARRLIQGMELVEGGRLDDVHVAVISTDEYADIFRGFHHMLTALREEQRILSISHDLSGELQLEVLIARIMRATTELLNAERSTLFLHDAATDELYSIFAEGDLVREIRIPASRGIAGAVFASGRTENIADPYADPRFDAAVDRTTGFRTRSILCQPILNKFGGRVGVTQVLNKHGGAFLAKDEARLRAFSAQIAVCLENAKLFDDVFTMKSYNESILKSTSNGVITFDTQHRIVTANAAALTLIGRPDGIAGQPAADVFVDDNRWIAQELDQADLQGEVQLAMDANIARPGALPACVNLTAAPLIDATEQRIGSMLVMEDITNEKRVRSTMARYMNKEVADQLLEAGESELVGKDQTVSILFSDVRGFTTIAERIGARETVAMLNSYFTEMVDVILANRGILDKYIGDAIMALFGAPFASAYDADNAIATANEMLVALARLNAARASDGMPAIDVGIGISTGDVIVGNIGSMKRMEYTVIGDSVNLASRLESANKVYGSKILFSESTMRQLSSPRLTREIDRIRVKGKDFPVGVYESLGYRADMLGDRVDAMLESYARGIAAYRARAWGDAEQAFLKSLAVIPSDGPSAMYVERCRAFADTPPQADWDGVWGLTSK